MHIHIPASRIQIEDLLMLLSLVAFVTVASYVAGREAYQDQKYDIEMVRYCHSIGHSETLCAHDLDTENRGY